MLLSGLEIQDIHDWFSNEQGKRLKARVGVQGNVSLVRVNDSGSLAASVKVRDISASGIGILHDTRLALDEQFVMLLPTRTHTIPMMCSVVYWEPLAPGLFGIGAKFDRILSAQDDILLAPQTAPAGSIGREGPITRLVHAIERKLRAAG